MSRQHVIVLSSRRRLTAQRSQFRYDVSELEYSEYGRDPRFLPGWWILPICCTALLSVLVCLT